MNSATVVPGAVDLVTAERLGDVVGRSRTLLIGIAAHHKSAFGADQIVKLIQSASKTFEHSLTYPAKAIEALADKGMTTPSALCALIRS